MNDAASEIKRQALLDEFDGIVRFIRTALEEGRTAHEVERALW
jgi:hypothetical protein